MLDNYGITERRIMTPPQATQRYPRDLLSLMSASMTEILAELEAAADDPGNPELPSRTIQLGDLVVAETVRLIRLGTRAELADAALAVSRALVGPVGARLAAHNLGARQLLTAASKVLSVAVSPFSSGSELTVLRSWSGRARDAVRLVAAAPESALARTDLCAALAVDEPYVSDLLGDLEAAGLVERIRDGESITVHLGPTARAHHVEELIGLSTDGGLVASEQPCAVRELFQMAVDGDELPRTLSVQAAKALGQVRRRILHFKRVADEPLITVEDGAIPGKRSMTVRMRVTGSLPRPEGSHEMVDHDVMWTVVVGDEGISDVRPWRETSDWLGIDTRDDRQPISDRYLLDEPLLDYVGPSIRFGSYFGQVVHYRDEISFRSVYGSPMSMTVESVNVDKDAHSIGNEAPPSKGSTLVHGGIALGGEAYPVARGIQ
jgi:DNA-binding transcriptional ArsR family regulator